MGAWDEGPRENDTALDYELGIFGSKNCDKFGPKDPDEQRYVAWLVMQLKPDFPNLKELAACSLVHMKALLCDTDWLGKWDNPNKVIDSIAEQISELDKLSA